MSTQDLTRVPNLITSLQGPLQQIEKHLLTQQTSIEYWLRDQLRKTPPPIYSSVDLRNSGFKLAPVDTNLFPAGFNNLNPDFFPLCIQAVQSTMEEICTNVKEVILIPEDHTRNIYYYENVAIIKQIFNKAGYSVRIGSLLSDLKSPKTIELPSGGKITLEPLVRRNGRLELDTFSPCMILLNNDLSAGIPGILQGLKNQVIMPALEVGWSSRFKSNHFTHYADVVDEFGKQFELDPWLLSSFFTHVDQINFMTREGEDRLVAAAEKLLTNIKQKYKEYDIQETPYLVAKADAGTYGMAVMTFQDPQELVKMNRKERSRMASIKGGKEVHRVLLQEGVYTFETWGEQQASAEPVIYMIGRYVIGGFYRVHAGKGINENLNAPGMNFQPLAFAEPCNNPDEQLGSCANRFYAYGVVGRLAMLAAARELQQAAKEKAHDN